MSGVVDHHRRIEGWVREALSPRGAEVGFLVLPSKLQTEEFGLGWTIVVSMRHPQLNEGDLTAPVAVPFFTLDQQTVGRICAEALKALDELADKLRAQMMAMPTTLPPGPSMPLPR